MLTLPYVIALGGDTEDRSVHITTLRLKNFQSFGPKPTTVNLTDMTFVLGPNGSGKTAVLEALARMFSPVTAQRAIRLTDFHAPLNSADTSEPAVATELWIEVEIEFPETREDGQYASVPPNFTNMRLESEHGVPTSRVRLTAGTNAFGEVEERIEYVLEVDEQGEPVEVKAMGRYDRGHIEVHYLPARRDPSDHISYATSSLIGRTLRAAEWVSERDQLADLSEQISAVLGANVAVKSLNSGLMDQWQGIHTGQFFKDPAIAFGHDDLEKVLRQLTIVFSPSHHSDALSFERLSDGQKSLLYISLVLAWQKLSQRVLADEETGLDPDKLRPPVHTIFAIEEPENSLAPQYLGRIIRQLRSACESGNAQALIATHAPALLRRVDPEDIRFLRLNGSRESTVHRITIPTDDQEAAKYVQEAVMAFPELYFSRLVVLGEGTSELVVLPRVLAAAGIAEDDASVSVVPLGGRHVNHFWRLLADLHIPYVTLLDLDAARYGGGWGRVRNALKQINNLKPTYKPEAIDKLPKWDDVWAIPRFGVNPKVLEKLESSHDVYFSYPVDLDLMMMEAFPTAYGVDLREPEDGTIEAVLGKKHGNKDLLGDAVLDLFEDYRDKFGRKSKPASHLTALARLDDDELMEDLPEVLGKLVKAIENLLSDLPE
jgi:putative ATP-dependent endonuclease of OLD family